MTAPPGGPYGQDPYGQDPYNQNPAWGGQPQDNPYQPNVDPYAQTQHYPTGQPYPAPGGHYPPPGGQYPPPGGQYPPPGGQYPPPGGPYGPPGGQYPPPYPPYGPPPRSKTPWVIGAVAAVLILLIAAVTAIFAMRSGDDTASTGGPSLTASPSVSMTPQSPSATTKAPTSKAPAGGDQTATECTPNLSGGEVTGSMAEAGALAFPLSAAPGWDVIADNSLPNGVGVVGVAREVPNAENWMMEAVVGVTNFVPSMDVAEQASKLMTCVSEGPGYEGAEPTLGALKASSIKVDGVEAARVDTDITIGDASRGLPGDTVVVIAVKTEPVTFFLSTTPIGDTASQATVEEIIKALKITSS